MGYNLHITRKEEPIISLEEWLKYIDSDPEFELGNNVHVGRHPVSGKTIKVKSDNIAYWSYGEHQVPFCYSEYGIWVKNPDENIIVKMLKISKELHAIVEGEEGEIIEESFIEFHENYEDEENEIEDSSEKFNRKPKTKKVQEGQTKKPWWKFW